MRRDSDAALPLHYVHPGRVRKGEKRHGFGSKNRYQIGLPWQVEAWTKTLLFNFEPHPNGCFFC